MMPNVFRARCSGRFFRICSVIAFVALIPSYSKAKWSPNFDQTITDPQQIKIKMKLSDQIQLHPGENDVMFFGDYAKDTFTFVKRGDFGYLHPNPQPVYVPITQAGEIVVLEGYSESGCPIDMFLPSVNDQFLPAGNKSWSLIPLGSYYNAQPGWSPYSDDPNCGNGPKKTIEFYQGTLKNIPTTFMLTAVRHGPAPQTVAASKYTIQVWAFTTYPEGDAGPPPASFNLFGQYTTAKAYANSAAALWSELALTTSKTLGGN